MHFLLQPIDNQRFLKIIAINGCVDEHPPPALAFCAWAFGGVFASTLCSMMRIFYIYWHFRIVMLVYT